MAARMSIPKKPDNGADDPDISAETEAELLARALAGVTPLTVEERILLRIDRPDRDLAQRRRKSASEASLADLSLDGSLAAVTPIAADARIEFHRPGLQLRQWRHLKQGAIPWQLGLDLHGATRSDALRAVERLIRQAQEEQVNCLRVVHGKGYGSGPSTLTLKAELNYWLRRNEQVLAFCSALPADGGAGAMYVLLRRRRD
ncbi:MAG: Smr/MutS family protein [Pseudomonadota bacterium]